MFEMCFSEMQRGRTMDGPPPFDFKTDGNCGGDWKVWLRGFEIFAQANLMENPQEKLNWMLHYAGAKVQSVFYSLPEKETTATEVRRGPLASGYVKFQLNDEYDDAVSKLCEFFEPKQNTTYERHVFRQLKQSKGERIDMFIMRLREQAERCEFGGRLEENIRDQVTSGCYSDVLQRKILERSDESFDQIVKMARILEVVSKQQKTFERTATTPVAQTDATVCDEPKDADVCKIDTKRKFGGRRNFQSNKSFQPNTFCGRCGLKGHKAADDNCPAKGQTCRECGRKDHFARRCFRTKSNGFNGKRKSEDVESAPSNNKVKREDANVQLVDADTKSISDEYEDIFCIDSNGEDNKMWCSIGGCDVEVVIDSGSRYNVVDKLSWMELKAKKIETEHRQKEVNLL